MSVKAFDYSIDFEIIFWDSVGIITHIIEEGAFGYKIVGFSSCQWCLKMVLSSMLIFHVKVARMRW